MKRQFFKTKKMLALHFIIDINQTFKCGVVYVYVCIYIFTEENNLKFMVIIVFALPSLSARKPGIFLSAMARNLIDFVKLYMHFKKNLCYT